MIIFTIPKPFTESHVEMIQNNAIGSWLQLDTIVDVVLCCDDEGVADAADRFNTIYIPDIERHEGVPVISDAFAKVQARFPNHRLVYVNTDIILFNDFVQASYALEFSEFPEFRTSLMVGDRYNWSNPRPITWRDGWQSDLRSAVMSEGWMDPPVCADYFVFPSGMIKDMPPFLIGRYAWDTWLVSHTYIERKIPVIDASQAVFVIHQDHSRHRHDRAHPLCKRNVAMITRDDLRTGGRTDQVPYIMTKEMEIEKR